MEIKDYQPNWMEIRKRITELIKIKNEFVNKLINNNYSSLKVYGIPRGGTYVALILCELYGFRMADEPEYCDIIVDDIYDSGETAKYYEQFKKPMFFVYDKRRDNIEKWIKFPWEQKPSQEIEYNITRLLEFIGEDPQREGLIDTPKRVIASYKELLMAGKTNELKITTFDANGHDQMIVEKNLPLYSFCEHHMIPFFGTCSVGYIPNERIVGISKIARVVDHFSRSLNTQEYLTDNIANYLFEKLEPKGIGVVITARHLCQEMRGIRRPGKMITSSLRGLFLKEQKVKEEFINFINKED